MTQMVRNFLIYPIIAILLLTACENQISPDILATPTVTKPSEPRGLDSQPPHDLNFGDGWEMVQPQTDNDLQLKLIAVVLSNRATMVISLTTDATARLFENEKISIEMQDNVGTANLLSNK